MDKNPTTPSPDRAEATLRCGVILLRVEGPMGVSYMRHPEIHLDVQQGLLMSWGMEQDRGSEMVVRVRGTPEQVASARARWQRAD